jgi:hypothetical protein
MSAIKIKLDPMPDGTVFGAMVDVIPLGEQQGVRRSRLAVSSSAPEPITVAHGRYLVQAIRPDGTVLSTTVDATDATDVVARLEHPVIEQKSGPKSSPTGSFVDEVGEVDHITLLSGWRHGELMWLPKFWLGGPPLDLLGYAELQLGSSRSLLHVLSRSRVRSGRDVALSALVVRQRNAVELLRVPETLSLAERVSSITLEWHKLAGDPLRFVATDPDVAMLTDYIASGDVLTASQLKPDLWNTAVAQLRMKLSCPPAAVIAGYLLVSTEHQQSDHDWTQWIENLANWFEDIPDGAIFSGWRALRNGDAYKARSRFAQAIGRGLPILSGSIRMLYRGLIALNDEHRLRQIHDVVTNVQPGRVFTTIRLEDVP